jgi:hypothetical protein
LIDLKDVARTAFKKLTKNAITIANARRNARHQMSVHRHGRAPVVLRADGQYTDDVGNTHQDIHR